MTREQEVQYEQDRLGNENRKLDTLRAQEGMAGENDETGIVNIGSASTGTDVIAYSLPTHVDEAIVTELHAYNSTGTGGTYSLFELDLDGNGSVVSSTRRSVPIEVVSEATRINSYEGLPFDKAIGVNADFEGFVGVGLIADHKEYNEPQAEDS